MSQPSTASTVSLAIALAATLLASTSRTEARTNSTVTQARPAQTRAPVAWQNTVQAVVGHVVVLPLPEPVSRVVVGDPRVADYRLISHKELYVLGQAVGTTNLVLWRQDGTPFSMAIAVSADLTPLQDSLQRALPHEKDIALMMSSGSVVLSGTVSDLASSDAALAMAQAFTRQLNRYLGSASGSNAASGSTSNAAAATVPPTSSVSASPSAGAGTGGQTAQVINLLRLRDDQRLQPLSRSIRQALPQEQAIELSLASGSVLLSGSVSNTLAAEAVLALAEAYQQRAPGGTAAGSRVINLLRVRDTQQVMLDVRIAEVSKSLLDQLGLRVQAAGGGGDLRWNILSNFLGGGNAVAGLLFRNGSAVNLDAEKRDGLVRILAEPSIVAMSGQEGSFLVGGKVFIPVTQSAGTAGSAVTLQEREFGVGLKFVPTVLDGGRISLKVAPEVSEISRESVSAGNQSAAPLLPAFTTRRVSTTVQLRDGQSLAIGGLIRNNSSASTSAFPILGELPVLGALFRSKQYAADLTELVVVVRASLVQASNTPPGLPTDKVTPPSSREFLLEQPLRGEPTGSDARPPRGP